MNRTLRFGLILLLPLALAGVLWWLTQGHTVAVLTPKGLIANRERTLMATALLLMLIVVLPVYALAITIAWRYRAGNPRAKYQPTWDHHRGLEALWWGLPCAIIAVLAVLTWRSSHDLDPFKPLGSTAPRLRVQVIALQWKWLFIYPDLGLATVNELELPVDTPVTFDITSDAPMNSFWIPQLGGQVYAMSGMKTQLHLIADTPGTYTGSSANLSGRHFADMSFKTIVSSHHDFNAWVKTVKATDGQHLTAATYTELAKPGTTPQPRYYGQVDDGIFQAAVGKYLPPTTGHALTGQGMGAMP